MKAVVDYKLGGKLTISDITSVEETIKSFKVVTLTKTYELFKRHIIKIIVEGESK